MNDENEIKVVVQWRHKGKKYAKGGIMERGNPKQVSLRIRSLALALERSLAIYAGIYSEKTDTDVFKKMHDEYINSKSNKRSGNA